MSAKKYSKIYMIEVKANIKDKEVIEYLINNMVQTITKVYKTSKVTITGMDRE